VLRCIKVDEGRALNAPLINSFKESKMFVYLITNTINGKRYVGQTIKSLEHRFKAHQHPSSSASYLYNAIKKYGVSNFSIEALLVVWSKKDLDFYERFLIKEFDLQNHDKGYNITDGGEGISGYRFSKEQRKRLSSIGRTRQARTGQFEGIRKLGQRAGGKVVGAKHKEFSTGIFASGIQSRGGKAGCKTQKENKIGLWAPENMGKGGRTNALSGHLVRIGWAAAHKRHHLPKNIVNPKCWLCKEAQ
jgi:group I intron endonuclease